MKGFILKKRVLQNCSILTAKFKVKIYLVINLNSDCWICSKLDVLDFCHNLKQGGIIMDKNPHHTPPPRMWLHLKQPRKLIFGIQLFHTRSNLKQYNKTFNSFGTIPGNQDLFNKTFMSHIALEIWEIRSKTEILSWDSHFLN